MFIISKWSRHRLDVLKTTGSVVDSEEFGVGLVTAIGCGCLGTLLGWLQLGVYWIGGVGCALGVAGLGGYGYGVKVARCSGSVISLLWWGIIFGTWNRRNWGVNMGREWWPRVEGSGWRGESLGCGESGGGGRCGARGCRGT
ncbi:unnamed protein product [Prunus armeniaca]